MSEGAAAFEFVVGVMLLALGAQVFYRFCKELLHYQVHEHAGSAPHMHVHSHKSDVAAHSQSSHEHIHPARLPFKAFAIGLIHGAAGSSGVIVLAISRVGDLWVAFGNGGTVRNNRLAHLLCAENCERTS